MRPPCRRDGTLLEVPCPDAASGGPGARRPAAPRCGPLAWGRRSHSCLDWTGTHLWVRVRGLGWAPGRSPVSCLLGCRVSEAGFSGPCIWVTGRKTLASRTPGPPHPPRSPFSSYRHPPPWVGPTLRPEGVCDLECEAQPQGEGPVEDLAGGSHRGHVSTCLSPAPAAGSPRSAAFPVHSLGSITGSWEAKGWGAGSAGGAGPYCWLEQCQGLLPGGQGHL